MVLKKAADELTAKAAFSAAKNALDGALTDALASDEERAQRKAEQAALAKRKRTKLIALIVVGLLLTLGLIGMVLSYWQWFILLGLLGLAALYGRHRWRQRRRARAADEVKAIRSPEVPRPSEGVRPRPPEVAAPTQPATESSAEVERAIEDELAALKARVK
jgi:hypothetical protein